MSLQDEGRGTLFVVGTPIGNLQDITLRAVETLKAVSVVAAEDTRRTRGLLTHLSAGKKTMLAVDAHANARKLEEVLEHLKAGRDVALVTDAGMPSVSDPGARLVSAARSAGIVVDVIPGPSALTAGLALSGLADGAFVFLGFLPRKGQKRRDALRRVVQTTEAVVLYEAPTRVRETLLELAALQPERRAGVCRELTKLHQEYLEDTLAELSSRGVPELGEYTLVLAPAPEGEAPQPQDLQLEIDAMLAAGKSVRDIADELSVKTGTSRREVFRLALERRDAHRE